MSGATRSFRQSIDDALHFWEPRRITYNLVLAAVTILWFARGWQLFHPTVTLLNLVQLLVLAVIANVLYCAGYVVDLPLQLSSIDAAWRRYRAWLWIAGMVFAVLLTSYWINDEIFADFAR